MAGWLSATGGALVSGMVCEYTPETYANRTRTKCESKEYEGVRRTTKEYEGIQWNTKECEGIQMDKKEYEGIRRNTKEYAGIQRNMKEYEGTLQNIQETWRIIKKQRRKKGQAKNKIIRERGMRTGYANRV